MVHYYLLLSNIDFQVLRVIGLKKSSIENLLQDSGIFYNTVIKLTDSQLKSFNASLFDCSYDLYDFIDEYKTDKK